MGGLRQQLRRPQPRLRGQLERQLPAFGRIRPPHRHAQPQQRGLHASRRTASASAAASRSTGPTTATPAATRCAPAPSCARRPIGRAGWSAPTTAKGDFNGDGFGDLAIGAPGENLGAGAVHVLYGSATGLTTTGSQFLSQGAGGIADAAEAGDEFGRSLAVGNFNSDGFNDLAIGAPGENRGAGTVHVLYGSASGLTATGSQQWTQDFERSS